MSKHREADPHEIIPDGFLDAFDAETPAEALEQAERAPSSTDPEDMRRCRNCWSQKCIRKVADWETIQRKPGAWKCNECQEHQDNPLPPPNEWDFYTGAVDRLRDAAVNGRRLDAAIDIEMQLEKMRQRFDWLDADELDDRPRPGFSRLVPDFEHGNRTEAILRALVFTQPWSDEEGLTNRETARYIHKGRGFVNYHRGKWRDGEHDELIRDVCRDDLREGPVSDEVHA